MRSLLIPILSAIVATTVMTGCNRDSAGVYPDQSAETQAEADAIRSEQKRKDEAIERELERTKTALTFESEQIAAKAENDREAVKIDRDQAVQPLEARKRGIQAELERKLEGIERRTETDVARASDAEGDRIRNDAEAEMAEAKRETAEEVADIEADIRKVQRDAEARLAKIDAREAKELADIDRRRTEAERKARERHLEVARETTAQLDDLADQSMERRNAAAEVDATARSEGEHERWRTGSASEDETSDRWKTDAPRNDQEVTEAIRQRIEDKGEPAEDVEVSTDDGVVTLEGSVPDEATREALVSDISTVAGVVRVKDDLRVE